jgi:glycosyltransferase involved in cell wall biosynthesis
MVMRCAYTLSKASVLTVPLEQVSWLPSRPTTAAFIPVGANLPALTTYGSTERTGYGRKTVVAFSTSAASNEQIRDLALAVKQAAEELGELQFLMLGRTMAGVEATIRGVLKDSPVQVLSHGLLPAEEISRSLARADVLLFTRGSLSTNRGSAIAAIACGLPVVAYGKPEPSSPLSEAGVLFVPYGDRERLARKLVEVLTNGQLWADLRRRNLHAYERYFSWPSIAGRYLDLLGSFPPPAAQIP